MQHQPERLAQKLFRTSFAALSPYEQRVVQRIAQGLHISRNTNREFDTSMTFGQRLADRNGPNWW
jgi:uncharacterized membrane protein